MSELDEALALHVKALALLRLMRDLTGDPYLEHLVIDAEQVRAGISVSRDRDAMGLLKRRTQ